MRRWSGDRQQTFDALDGGPDGAAVWEGIHGRSGRPAVIRAPRASDLVEPGDPELRKAS